MILDDGCVSLSSSLLTILLVGVDNSSAFVDVIDVEKGEVYRGDMGAVQ